MVIISFSGGDVVKYISDNPNQTKMFPEEEGQSCMSYYSICE